MRETLEDALETTKTVLVELLDEAFGLFGMNIKGVGSTVRADRVYYLQSCSYRRGFVTGMLATAFLAASVALHRDATATYEKNRQLIELRRTEQRQQQTTERMPNMLVSQDK